MVAVGENWSESVVLAPSSKLTSHYIPGVADIGPAIQPMLVFSSGLADPLKVSSGFSWDFGNTLVLSVKPQYSFPRLTAFNASVALRILVSLNVDVAGKPLFKPALVFFDVVKYQASMAWDSKPCRPGGSGHSAILISDVYSNIGAGMDISLSANIDPSPFVMVMNEQLKSETYCTPLGDNDDLSSKERPAPSSGHRITTPKHDDDTDVVKVPAIPKGHVVAHSTKSQLPRMDYPPCTSFFSPNCTRPVIFKA